MRSPAVEGCSPAKHACADVAGPDRDRQRDKWSVLNKEIERIRGAVAFGSRLVAEASDAPFNLAGCVLNRVRRYAFYVLNQTRQCRASPRQDPRETAQARNFVLTGAVMIAKPPIVARHPLRRRGDDYA